MQIRARHFLYNNNSTKETKSSAGPGLGTDTALVEKVAHKTHSCLWGSLRVTILTQSKLFYYFLFQILSAMHNGRNSLELNHNGNHSLLISLPECRNRNGSTARPEPCSVYGDCIPVLLSWRTAETGCWPVPGKFVLEQEEIMKLPVPGRNHTYIISLAAEKPVITGNKVTHDTEGPGFQDVSQHCSVSFSSSSYSSLGVVLTIFTYGTGCWEWMRPMRIAAGRSGFTRNTVSGVMGS